MSGARKTITKKTRFEVFKRDGFKCVYCGACAPEAVLVVDHIDPVAKGGANEILNYATACQPCNAGKSDRKLSDNSVLEKQRRQLQELNERREQLEMMLEWRSGLKNSKDLELDALCDAWRQAAKGWTLTDLGKKDARSYIRKHGLTAALDAIEIAVESYLKVDDDGEASAESVSTAWKKVGGILTLKAMPDEQRRLFYVQGILRKRFSYVPYDAVRRMQGAMDVGAEIEEIEAEAKAARSWYAFSLWLEGFVS